MCAYVIPNERGAAREAAYPELERFTSSAFDLMFGLNTMCNNNNDNNNPVRFTIPPFGSHKSNQLIQINAERFPLNKLRVTTSLPGCVCAVRAV